MFVKVFFKAPRWVFAHRRSRWRERSRPAARGRRAGRACVVGAAPAPAPLVAGALSARARVAVKILEYLIVGDRIYVP